jgi:cell division septation protein DedD
MSRDGDRDDDLFETFDSDWELDDLDRDSDFAAIYHEDEPEDEPPYFDDLPEDETSTGNTAGPSHEVSVAVPEIDRPDTDPDDGAAVHADAWPDSHSRDEDLEVPPESDVYGEPDTAPPVSLPPLGTYTAVAQPSPIAPDSDDDHGVYEDEDDYDYDDYAEEHAEPTFPLGLVIVGVIALGLLIFGGYGVVQQRAALQEEVRQLQSRLATTASPTEVAKTRAASETLQQRNADLEAQLVGLERENRTLQATVVGLEKQLAAQQQALQRSPAAAVDPAPEPAPAPVPEPEQRTAASPTPSTPTASGNWFVNFGSYGQEDIARRWAGRLQPDAGRVIVTTGDKDGRTFYRVRVVGLASQEAANATARALERKYGLDRLWVGESG